MNQSLWTASVAEDSATGASLDPSIRLYNTSTGKSSNGALNDIQSSSSLVINVSWFAAELADMETLEHGTFNQASRFGGFFGVILSSNEFLSSFFLGTEIWLQLASTYKTMF